MEREIIFRGKVNTSGNWVYGNLIVDAYDNHHIIKRSESVKGKMMELDVYPETVCQFINIKDKLNCPIYEDDIVKTHDGRIGVVTYLSGCFCVVFDMSKTTKFEFIDHINDLEVIGNIFDNPNLYNV